MWFVGEIALRGWVPLFLLFSYSHKKRGNTLLVVVLFYAGLKSISTSASKSVVMPLEDWAKAMELAQRYKQQSISRAIVIAVRKAHNLK